MEAPDEQLMLAYRDGDSAAFETLYTRHRARLYRFVLRSVKSRAIGEELFQEIWTRVIRNSPSTIETSRRWNLRASWIKRFSPPRAGRRTARTHRSSRLPAGIAGTTHSPRPPCWFSPWP